RMYEERKVHFIVVFYCFVVAVILFSALEFSAVRASEPTMTERFLTLFDRHMNKINHSIEQDWGR
ncbi:MAG: hypothetical protein ACOCWO_02035, partial [Candidatus Muiribacteriaceae bacterium]